MQQVIERSKKNDLFKFLDMPLQMNREPSKQKVPITDFKSDKPEKDIEILKNIENFDDYCTEFSKFEKQMNAKYNSWKQNQKQISPKNTQQPEKVEKESPHKQRMALNNSIIRNQIRNNYQLAV
ncbi:hypothetical protein TTHERM_00361890 (macronuclear) [Tetrahymena thermophila SB210]|uniref:Uncharacterized protein n=1 Tax=Tetrahymena thermophila (strain SB210) TaxID=312017 RepID=Q22PF5_TETTS|nr:hypothetical protein TTHERM_00361890 [Tetrahymena thermophila SB210]EAR87154.2 hypothetical protein TTHERM_00361890 [Tetrahymena thermophila SB210]|eukprot:XP_001007399.2 hypothetical protein TTHERM_00361890 [Tetrahymena thermophila SB210]